MRQIFLTNLTLHIKIFEKKKKEKQSAKLKYDKIYELTKGRQQLQANCKRKIENCQVK